MGVYQFNNSSIPAVPPPIRVTTTIDFYPLGFFLLIITILGMIGNILTILVWTRPKLRSCYSTLATILAVCDFTYLFTKFMRYGFLSFLVDYGLAKGYTDYFFPFINPYLRAITFTSQMASAYMTIALAIDRYISVCWAFHAKTICNQRNALNLSLMMISFATLYNIPRWMEFQTVPVTLKDENSTLIGYKMQATALRGDPEYKLYYIFWAYMFVINLIPLGSLIFLNFMIVHTIRTTSKSQASMNSLQKHERSLTIMLFCIVGVYIFTNSGYVVTDIFDYFKKSYPSIIDSIANVMLTLNMAVNFVIYSAFGRKFRSELGALFVQKCMVGQKEASVSHPTSSTGVMT